ncbi:MAG: hypothetical protein IPP83_18910 [Flavobacteriales bacterium]|nr:hypothetical protein [Flavobacteriales bacterium]
MGTLRNVLGIVSSLIAISGLVYALFLQEATDETQLADKVFIVLVATVLILTAGLAWSTAKLQSEIKTVGALPSDHKALTLEHGRLRKQFDNVTDSFHSLAHLQRNLSVAFYNKNMKTLKAEEFDSMFKLMEQYLSVYTSHIAALMNELSGGRCAVCIKLCLKTQEAPQASDLANSYVMTWYRDNKSYRKRKLSDYDRVSGQKTRTAVEKNTAFKKIMNPRERDSTYLRDNLLELAEAGEYQNDNTEWKSLYTATAVVPICLPVEKNERARRILGFVCVDNKEGGLQNSLVENILCALADSFYPLAARYIEAWTIADTKKWNNGQTRDLPIRGNR